MPFILQSNISAHWLTDLLLLLVIFAFFSCGVVGAGPAGLLPAAPPGRLSVRFNP